VRQSLDLDFSLDGDLGPLEEVEVRVGRLLTETFRGEGLSVFDVQLSKAPPNVVEDTIGDFWGGYTLDFKVMPMKDFDQLESKPEKRRRQAIEIGRGGRRTFTVDLSKHEYCGGKVAHDLEGYRVFVYSGLMMACEKVRAICQQMDAYRAIVKSSSRRPRARDFFDIHYLVTKRGVDLTTEEAWVTTEHVFAAKRVPLRLIGQISEQRDFHRDDFAAVVATVDTSIKLQSFDFYVDFLVDQLRPLQARWKVNAPSA
jgi:hypothetical protein